MTDIPKYTMLQYSKLVVTNYPASLRQVAIVSN